MLQQKETAHQPVGQFEDNRFEKIHNIIYKSSSEASIIVANEIASLIRQKQREKSHMSMFF